jgi:hypothetical protein
MCPSTAPSIPRATTSPMLQPNCWGSPRSREVRATSGRPTKALVIDASTDAVPATAGSTVPLAASDPADATELAFSLKTHEEPQCERERKPLECG